MTNSAADTLAKLTNHFLRHGRGIVDTEYRGGDIVFFHGFEADGRLATGFALLTDVTHRLAFDPYSTDAPATSVPLPPTSLQLRYYRDIPGDPFELGRAEAMSLLWGTFERATSDTYAPEGLLLTPVTAVQGAEVSVHDRLDGYIVLEMKNDEAGYPPPRR